MMALVLLACILAPPQTGTVLGTVTRDLDGSAVAGAVVRLWEPRTSDSTLTDSLGFYSLKLKLTPERHTLRASHGAYLPMTRAVVLDSGGDVRVDFRIHPDPLEMPAVTVEDRRQWWYDSVHNDSVLRFVGGLECVHAKPWLIDRTLIPDSAAIRFNNEIMATAVASFRQRTRGLFRRPSSYCLRGENNYLVINRGRCRLIRLPEYPRRRAWLFDIDSLRLSVDSLGLHAMPPGTPPQNAPLQLEALMRDGRWAPVLTQHVVFEL